MPIYQLSIIWSRYIVHPYVQIVRLLVQIDCFSVCCQRFYKHWENEVPQSFGHSWILFNFFQHFDFFLLFTWQRPCLNLLTVLSRDCAHSTTIWDAINFDFQCNCIYAVTKFQSKEKLKTNHKIGEHWKKIWKIKFQYFSHFIKSSMDNIWLVLF